MRKIILTAALLIPILTVGRLSAQVFCSAEEQKEYGKAFYKDYSRWSLGADAGISFVWGDLKSIGAEKTSIGGLFGINVGYQLTPTVGLNLSADYGMNRANPKHSNKLMFIEPNGFTSHGATPPSGALQYNQIYAKIESWHIGLNADINVNNLIAGNKGQGNRRFTVLVSPGIYLNRFKPTLYKRSNDKQFSSPDLHYDWSIGLGGDVSLRYKASKLIDLALKGGAIWITNNKFDGVSSATTRKLNGLTHISAGITFKIGARSKKDHLMYAATHRYAKRTFDPAVMEVIKTEIQVVEKAVEVEKIVTVEVYADGLSNLPTIHFERGSMDINEEKFVRELHDIVSVLKKHPTANIQIWGYADHTGGVEINDKISFGRAEALRNYLVEQGIDIERIIDIKGLGKDPKLEGEDAFSNKARRSEVVND